MLFAIAKYGAVWSWSRSQTSDDKEHCEWVCDMDVFHDLLEFMSAPSNNRGNESWGWRGCAVEKKCMHQKKEKRIDECGFSASSSSLLVVNQKFSHCLCYVHILCAHSMESVLRFRLCNKIKYEDGVSLDETWNRWSKSGIVLEWFLAVYFIADLIYCL